MPNDDKLPLTSLDPSAERVAALRELFPEAWSEGQLDTAKLTQLIGQSAPPATERYGLSWAGKADAHRAVQSLSTGTLRPVPAESVNFDSTENLIIEGDNLEVLKLLQKSYSRKVKMIYIDPPYNTGNEFIYPDNFREGLQTYLEYSGQVKEGVRQSTNSETSGRYHSNWLNMMYPRLFLARNLLKDDGVIFVSIDDHEVHNLRLLLNEVFGEENFVICLIWHRRQMADSRNEDRASTDHEYILVYQRSNAVLRGVDIDLEKYQNPDNDPRGPWFSADITGLATKDRRPNLHYEVVNPKTGIVYPPSATRGWSCSKENFQHYIADERILWPSKEDGRPRLKKFLNEVTNFQTGFSSMLKIGFTTEGTREIQELFGEKVFQFPKPVALAKAMAHQTTDSDDIILDFFAGSGTTAQAMMELNQEDGGSRKFILVQLPEPTDNADYSTIAEITKERVRRVITKLDADEAGRLPNGDAPQDRGFKVLKLDSSNFKVWDADNVPSDADALGEQLQMYADHLLEGRSQTDVLYELLLKSGYPLTAAVEERQLNGQTVYVVAGGELFICLDVPIAEATLREIIGLSPERVLCLDAAFEGNDQLKTNIVLQMRDAEIEFHTV